MASFGTTSLLRRPSHVLLQRSLLSYHHRPALLLSPSVRACYYCSNVAGSGELAEQLKHLLHEDDFAYLKEVEQGKKSLSPEESENLKEISELNQELAQKEEAALVQHIQNLTQKREEESKAACFTGEEDFKSYLELVDAFLQSQPNPAEVGFKCSTLVHDMLNMPAEGTLHWRDLPLGRIECKCFVQHMVCCFSLTCFGLCV